MRPSSSTPLDGTRLTHFPLAALGEITTLPVTVRILLEGIVRAAGTGGAKDRDVGAIARYPAAPPESTSVPFRPTRILLQDYTGVPAAVDLAAMRAAMQRAGKDPAKIEPLIPVDLIIDHSVQADFFGAKDVYERNLEREYERNRERYALLRWAGQAFKTIRVVPPGAGICHQVNLERLAQVVLVRDAVAERATVSNMCPEYGATSALFPVDRQTLRYLEQTGRPRELIDLVERYTKAQGMFRSDGDPTPTFDELIEVDLGSVHPSVSGPKRPQDRVDLPMIWDSFTGPKPTTGLPRPGETEGPKKVNDAAQTMVATATPETAAVAHKPRTLQVNDGSVVIAAITSCTNTSNPSVIIGAGLLAKSAVERGLRVKPHVKTTFAPGSRVVTRYLEAAGLTPYLEQLGFFLVGFGCTICIGNSGPLATPEIEQEVKEHDLNVVSVLSGNRNFEGRIHPLIKSSYLASPPLVVAYALAGTVHIDLQDQPIGNDKDGKPVFLKDLWPSPEEVNEVVGRSISQQMFAEEYGKIFDGDRFWKTMPSPTGLSYKWDPNSTYVQEPPFFQNFSATPPATIPDIVGARVLVSVGDSVTTDHISPAGSIPAASPAGQYLVSKGVKPVDFNQYGTRRGNHEVLIRGTFANIRLRNKLVEREGWWTRHFPSGEEMTIYDATVRYQKEGVPLLVFAGKEYGAGSSRDWAAKGPILMGVRAVIAESFERIHRSNLVMMGILPLEFMPGETMASLGLTGAEMFTIRGLGKLAPKAKLNVEATSSDGKKKTFTVLSRVDDPTDLEYVRQGGILHQVLRERIAAT